MLRPGVKETFPSTPLLFGQKTLKRNNILIGYDPTQERFVERFLGLTSQLKDNIRDEDLLGLSDPVLFRVEHARNLELSPQVRNKTGLYSLEPLTKGSAGVFAIVREAATILGMEYNQELVANVADLLCKEPIYDVPATVWQAVWLLTGPILEFKRWPEPWATRDWFPTNVDPQFRLNTLYRDLVTIVYARGNDEDSAHKFGVRPSRFKVLKSIGQNLDLNCVDRSIRELSRWRQQKYNPFVCALKITSIWHSTVS